MTRALAAAVALVAACGDPYSLPIDALDPVGLEAGLGTLSAEPPKLEGNVSGDAPWPIRITNTWAAPTAPLSTTLTGPDAHLFVLLDNTCRGYALAAGESCQVAVAMPCKMNEGGYRDAVLEVVGMPGGSVSVPIRLRMYAKSCTAALFLNPGSQSFGNHVVDVASSSLRFTISNAGGKASAPLLHTLAGNDPEEFMLVGSTCAGASVPPGGSCTFDVVFYPRTLGAKTAQIVTTTPSTSNSAFVTGTGVAAASARP